MSWWPAIVQRLWGERDLAAWLVDHGTPPGVAAYNPYVGDGPSTAAATGPVGAGEGAPS